MKSYTVYEIVWTRCEYGGPSVPAGSTFHRTREAAEEYRQGREGSSMEAFTSDDPFYYQASSPQLKVVGKSEYRRLDRGGFAMASPKEKTSPEVQAPSDDKIILRCPNCNQQLRVPRGKSGTIQCPSCSKPFQAAT